MRGRFAVALAGVCACAAAAAADSAPPQGSLVIVNPASSRVAWTVRLGAEPMRVSWGDGAFWVVAPKARTIVRVDPRTRRVARRKLGKEPYDAATGAGALWVSDHDGFDVLRVDWRTATIRHSPRFAVPELAIAYGFGAVWTIGADGTLLRLDPKTLKPTGRVLDVVQAVERYEPKIALARDALWISDAVRNRVIRVDPVRLRITARVARGGAGVALAAGAVWSTDSFAKLWRVSPGRPAAVHTASGAVDVASGQGSLWVVNRFAGTLSRVDPRSRRVTATVRVGGYPLAVADGAGMVAVAVR